METPVSYTHLPYILADTKIFGGYAAFSAKRNTVHTYALPFGGPSPLYSGAFPLKCCRRRADLRVLFVQRQGKGGEEFLQEAVGGGQAHGPDRRLGGGAGEMCIRDSMQPYVLITMLIFKS